MRPWFRVSAVVASLLLLPACTPDPEPVPADAGLSAEDRAACEEYVPAAVGRVADGDALEDQIAAGGSVDDGALAERDASGLELDATALRLADSGVTAVLEARLRDAAYLRPRGTVGAEARYYIALDAIQEWCRE